VLPSPPLFHPNFGVFPVDQIAHVVVSVSTDSRQTGGQRDGRTVRQTTYCNITALCIASRCKTRTLRYRKDDRMMRPIYGCPENFRESLTTYVSAAFPEIFTGLLFLLSLCAYKIGSS